ncbi:hypothetical protein L0F63_003640 [Massospora cicadina]|nr:hypothetical protein L0F63_003640 [Massospora cicadina]
MSKLFIGSLSWNVDSDSMRAAFEKFGEVTDSFVCRDRETQRSRGFGFVTFADEGSAQRAIEEMNGSELDGRQIRVDKASEQTGNGGGRTGGYGGRNNGPRSGGYGRSDGGYDGQSGGRSGGYGGDRSEGGYGGSLCSVFYFVTFFCLSCSVPPS